MLGECRQVKLVPLVLTRLVGNLQKVVHLLIDIFDKIQRRIVGLEYLREALQIGRIPDQQRV